MKLSFSRPKPSCGFTLLELLIVVAIVGTLASIALPLYSNQILKAKISKAIFDIRALDKAIQAYRFEHEKLPDFLDDVDHESLIDPWGNVYQYANHDLVPPGHRRKYRQTVPLNTDYDLYSMGPDGKTNYPVTSNTGRDDIIRADNGRFVGSGWEF